MALEGGVLRLDGLSGAGLGATVEGEAEVTLLAADGDSSKPRPAPELHARLEAHGVEMAALARWQGLEGTGRSRSPSTGRSTIPTGTPAFACPRSRCSAIRTPTAPSTWISARAARA